MHPCVPALLSGPPLARPEASPKCFANVLQSLRVVTTSNCSPIQDLQASAVLDTLLLAVQQQLGPFSCAAASLGIRLGETQEGMQDFANAVQSYTEVLQGAIKEPSALACLAPSEPGLSKVWSFLALAHKRNNSWIKAEQAYRQAYRHSMPDSRYRDALLNNMMTM